MRRRIGYVTDVEGNWAYWDAYVKRSGVLQREKNGVLALKRGSHFVFGGDAVDKGSGDMRFLRDIVSLKEAYPDRVHIILGNRDINKMRVKQELDRERVCTDEVYWIKEQRLTFAAACKATGFASPTHVHRLQWMLRNTMGCRVPDTFSLRKAELAVLHGSASDEDTLQSYLSQIRKQGLLSRLLQHSMIGLTLGDALFLHGAIPEHALYRIPPRSSTRVFPDSYTQTDNVHDWVTALNQFKEHEVESWIDTAPCSDEQPWSASGGYGGSCGNGLLQYGMGTLPNKQRNPSVVYASWDVNGRMSLGHVDDAVQRALVNSGVRVVLTGHKPQGDAPTLMRSRDIAFIASDTSYSNAVEWNDGSSPAASDNRGDAVTALVLEQVGDKTESMTAEGILSNGKPFSFSISPTLEHEMDYIGRETSTRWMVKGETEDGFLLSQGNAFRVFNRVVTETELLHEM